MLHFTEYIGNKYYYLTLLSSDVSKSESIEY